MRAEQYLAGPATWCWGQSRGRRAAVVPGPLGNAAAPTE